MEIMIVILVIVAIYVLSGIKVVNQYQRGVVLTLGKFTGVREPGLRVVVPIFQTMMMVDVRSTPIDVPKQEVITKDNVTVGVDAVVYFRVINAPKAVLETTNYIYATSQFAQAALRDVTGKYQELKPFAKRSVLIFAIGVLIVVCYALSISKSVGLVEKPILSRDNAIISFMLTIGFLIVALCKVDTSKLLSTSTFQSGSSELLLGSAEY